MTTSPGSPLPPTDTSHEPAAESMKGANPFIGLTRGQVAAASARWAGRAAATARRGREGNHEDDAVADRRARRLADVGVPRQGQAVCRPGVARTGVGETGAVVPRHPPRSCSSSVDELDLDDKSAERARFASMQVTEAAAPTNMLTNPVALRRAVAPEDDRSSTVHDTWRATCATTAECRARSTPDRSRSARRWRARRAPSCIAPSSSSCCSTRRRRRQCTPDRW